MMRAYSYSRYGSPDVLNCVELPVTVPRPNEVLVKIFATTVSSADWRMRSLTMPAGLSWIGRPAVGFFGPRKPVLGTDFSGIIEAVGDDVTLFCPGEAVIGFPGSDLGAHAEYICMPENGRLVRKPENLSHETAAALPFGAMTAYDFLVNKGDLRAGERILINGASGSVGSACVQIAKHLGAHVTGVCGPRNAQMVRDLGADRVMDYQTQDFCAEAIRYNVIVDTAATAPWKRARHALRPGGRMLLIAANASDMIFGGLKARLRGQRLFAGAAIESCQILEEVTKMAAAGTITPVIGNRYSFDQMIVAHADVDTGHKGGNVVVLVNDDDKVLT